MTARSSTSFGTLSPQTSMHTPHNHRLQGRRSQFAHQSTCASSSVLQSPGTCVPYTQAMNAFVQHYDYSHVALLTIFLLRTANNFETGRTAHYID